MRSPCSSASLRRSSRSRRGRLPPCSRKSPSRSPRSCSSAVPTSRPRNGAPPPPTRRSASRRPRSSLRCRCRAVGGVQGSVLGDLLSLPARYWALGPALVAQTIFDAGLRQAQKEQAIAVWDETVASYRSTVLTGFQEVEDNLAALVDPRARGRSAGRGGQGRARVGDDRHQPVQGRHRELSRRRRAADRGAQQRAHGAQRSSAAASTSSVG